MQEVKLHFAKHRHTIFLFYEENQVLLKVREFYNHGSVHHNSILIRFNSMQVFIYCKITLYVSGVYRTRT